MPDIPDGTEIFGIERTIPACPFCEMNKPGLAEENAGYAIVYFVMCSACGAQGPEKDTAQCAIEYWSKCDRKKIRKGK